MTFLHLLVLALGIPAALAAADLLGHRNIGPWPIGLVALALIPVAGWFYSPWIAAFALGLAVGAAGVIVTSWTRSFVHRRQTRREQARQREHSRSRQLEEPLTRDR
ncbi:hypothetical protein [Brachybacterium sp. FME24]|uniref:hypothetical protein n=1 Tax=Brachybacterium sp. FME24 TaxID=2742605 RepID=UPI0018692B35|nr:hypothetical protein [Brachybacterium sp. FME24]